MLAAAREGDTSQRKTDQGKAGRLWDNADGGDADGGNYAVRPEIISVDVQEAARGARVLPEVVHEDRALGVEPGGGVRAIAAGIRVVSLPSGAVLATKALSDAVFSTAAIAADGTLYISGTGGNLYALGK